MNIRLGVYEIFSRIVPGAFYLIVFCRFAIVMNWIEFDPAFLSNIGIVPSLGLLLVAYVFGAGMNRLGDAWHQIFRKRDRNDSVVDEFKKEHPDWKLDFKHKDWAIMRAYIRMHSPEVANLIDTNNALSIMLRNISLGLALLSLCEIVQIVNSGIWTYALLVVLFVFLSYQTGLQARDLHDWFYQAILQTIVAYRLDLADRVKPVKSSREIKK